MVETEVLRRHEPRFNMAGQKLPDHLFTTSEQIEPDLAARLHSYAFERLTDLGFPVEEWACRVSTADGDLAPDERFYVVDFRHPKGAVIGLQGILLGSDGAPCLDHGLCIDAEDAIEATGGDNG